MSRQRASGTADKKIDKLMAEWFWVDRWTGSTAFSLPMEARGVYREMLSQAWRRSGKLPNDHEAIRRIIGATEREWKRTWLKIQHSWRVEGDSLVNDTQLEVYAESARRPDQPDRHDRITAAVQ